MGSVGWGCTKPVAPPAVGNPFPSWVRQQDETKTTQIVCLLKTLGHTHLFFAYLFYLNGTKFDPFFPTRIKACTCMSFSLRKVATSFKLSKFETWPWESERPGVSTKMNCPPLPSHLALRKVELRVFPDPKAHLSPAINEVKTGIHQMMCTNSLI